MELKPTLLLILDGWGLADNGPGNAVSLANTPNLDLILSTYPKCRLSCSGRAVGLPKGFMGNSEVGHMNIGAGRVVYQDMTRIDLAIENSSIQSNPAINELMDKIKAASGRIHFMGLLSDAGVHSHLDHLFALLRIAAEKQVPALIHAILDGRDTSPTSGKGYVKKLLDEMQLIGNSRLATLVGRYWAMDRDKRWDRNARAYNAMIHGQGDPVEDPLKAMQDAYDQGETDEFIQPRILLENGKPYGILQDGDGVFFFNFRADRARQIVSSLFLDDFSHFERGKQPRLSGLATMTEYDSSFGLPAAFPPQAIEQTLGQVLSEAGLKQLRIAETEKYAHVTYFFNCGREEPFPQEERILIPSPRDVPTYDHKPAMSALEVTEIVLDKIRNADYPLIVCNLANLDMVGHTGVLPAAIEAAETVDACAGRLAGAIIENKGRMLLTADHGNAEEMLDAQGKPVTAHSKNQVPFVLVESGCQRKRLRNDGVLGDIAPTILDLWEVDKPAAMTGRTLMLCNEDENG